MFRSGKDSKNKSIYHDYDRSFNLKPYKRVNYKKYYITIMICLIILSFSFYFYLKSTKTNSNNKSANTEKTAQTAKKVENTKQKEEEERNAQQRRAILELNQSVENITTDFINDAYQSVGEAINPFFDQQIAEVQHQLNALKSESNVLDEAFKTVTQSQTAMLAIQW